MILDLDIFKSGENFSVGLDLDNFSIKFELRIILDLDFENFS